MRRFQVGDTPGTPDTPDAQSFAAVGDPGVCVSLCLCVCVCVCVRAGGGFHYSQRGRSRAGGLRQHVRPQQLQTWPPRSTPGPL